MNPGVQDWLLICQYGAAFPQSEKNKDDHDWSLAGMAYPNHKAVATDFEVVRPGSGCGLFNMGVVC